MNADAVATVAGKPAPRINKRQGDDRVYRVDCTPLLRQYELLVAVTSCAAAGLQVSGGRTREGRFLEVRIAASSVVDGSSHQDHAMHAVLRTSQGAIDVAVDVRVFA